MIRYAVLCLALSASLQGCSALDILKTFSPTQPGIAVDAQVGDRQAIVGDKREQEVEVETETGDVEVSTDNTKNTSKQQFTGDVGDITINNGAPWLIAALVAFGTVGWLCPRPSTMWRNWRDKRSK